MPRIVEETTLARLPGERTDRVFPVNDAKSVGLYLGLKLCRAGAAAIFVGTRLTANSLAEIAVDAFRRELPMDPPSLFSDENELNRLVALYSVNLGENSIPTRAARLGIFSHHASTPHGIRLAVEYAMKENLIRLIVCTSTLAQGVNLPLRYLIITTAQQGDQTIKTRDFHNLMGRAGRAGMYTEGTVIFSDTRIFDGKGVVDEAWRWNRATSLLDPANSEDCGSSLLATLGPLFSVTKRYEHQLDVEALLSAHIAGEEGRKTLADELMLTLRAQNRRGFTNWTTSAVLEQLRAKSESLSAIESFLMANWPDDESAEWTENLAQSTLAYHTASQPQRASLLRIFAVLAGNIAQNVSQPVTRKMFSRNLLGVAESIHIHLWVDLNADQLAQLADTSVLLVAIWPLLLRFILNGNFTKCTNQDLLLDVAQSWISGTSFHEILQILSAPGNRIGDRNPTINHTVEICESALGFEGMLIVGAVADNIEALDPEDENTPELLRQLQKQLRYGLLSQEAIRFYEMGFADRAISQALSDVIPAGRNRQATVARLRQNSRRAERVLSLYPAYFTMIFKSLVEVDTQ